MSQKFSSKAERVIRRKCGQAIQRFNLLENQDRVLVAVSGGKDSLVMLDILRRMPGWCPISFEIVPFTIDPGFEGFDVEVIRREVARTGLELTVATAPIAEILDRKKTGLNSYCSLCSRLRRGAIYGAARRLNCNKIALGHHADDLIETLLLNAFFTGELKSMPPRLQADDGRNVVIRPLCLLFESEINDYFKTLPFSAVDARCPEKDIRQKKRQWVKGLISDLEKVQPYIRHNLLASLENVRGRFLLDSRLAPGSMNRGVPEAYRDRIVYRTSGEEEGGPGQSDGTDDGTSLW